MDELWVDFGGTGKMGRYLTLNIDNGKAHESPDIVCDILYRSRQIEKHLKFESVDKARCLHTLEHLPPYEVVSTLSYWRQFLKPNAPILIVVPDIEQTILTYASKEGLSVDFDVLMGMLYVPVEWQKKDDDHHRWGYNAYTLSKVLKEAGFPSVQILERYPVSHFVGGYAVRNLAAVAIKSTTAG